MAVDHDNGGGLSRMRHDASFLFRIFLDPNTRGVRKWGRVKKVLLFSATSHAPLKSEHFDST